MIPKLDLQSIINKYYLNGLNETVKWEIKDKTLTIKFTSPTREMIGEVSCDNFKLEDSAIGISNTTQLLKLIGITSSELLLSYVKNNKQFVKLIISDTQFTVDYALADILTIPKAGSYTGPDEFNLVTELTEEHITALIKAKSALPESTIVIFQQSFSLDNDFQVELVFGGDIEYANKVSYCLTNFEQNNVSTDFRLGFSSELLKEILTVNRNSVKTKMSLNLEGLMKLEFLTSEGIKSTYYIVKKDI
jgi:plasmid maintenance system antidote protein VapI